VLSSHVMQTRIIFRTSSDMYEAESKSSLYPAQRYIALLACEQ
jgi:hypothetical protein